MSGEDLENEEFTENPEPEADTDLHIEDELHSNSHAEDEFHINNNAPNVQENLNYEHEVGENVNANSHDSEDQHLALSDKVISGNINSNPESIDSRQSKTEGCATANPGFNTLETPEADICDDFEAPEDELGLDIPEAEFCEVAGQVDDVEANFCSNELNEDEINRSDEAVPVCFDSNGTSLVPQVLKLTKSESVESYEPECDQESSIQNNVSAIDKTDSGTSSSAVDTSCGSANIVDTTETSSCSWDTSCEHESKVSDGFQNSSYNSFDDTVECSIKCDEVDGSQEENSSLDNVCVQNSFKGASSHSGVVDMQSNSETICEMEDLGESLLHHTNVMSACNDVNTNDRYTDKDKKTMSSAISDDDLLTELDSELGGANGSDTEVCNSCENDPEHISETSEKHKRADNDTELIVDEVISKNNDFSAEAWQVIQDLQQKLSKTRQQLHRQERHLQKSNEDYSDLHMKFEGLTAERENYLREIEKQHNPDDLYLPQIKELEYTISQQQKEINSLRDKLSNHDAAAKRAVTALQGEIKQRTDQMTKVYKEAVTEKNQMVVKYAQAEKNNLGALKSIERLESKIKDNAKEKENLLGKIKDLKIEKTRLGHELDLKTNEALSLKKEAEKVREQVSSSDVRIKWAQNKLKAELDSHKDTKANLEKMNQRLKEAKEETEQIRRNCQEIVKTYQESEEIKSNNLDQQLKKKQTELLLQETESKDKEELYTTTMKELEQLKIKHREALAELQTYQDKTLCLEEEHRKDEDTMHKFKHMLQKQKTENKDLQDKVEHMVQLQTDFRNAQKTIKSLDSEISTLKISNKDLSIEMEGCRKREAEKLELTEKLSAKNAELQSENSALNDKVMALSVEVQSIRMDLQSKETNLDDLTRRLTEETNKNQQEISQLSEKLKEKSKKVDELSTKIDDEKDEIKTLKRKHVNSMKDLTRQLQQARRKLETFESNGEKDSTSLGSRTSSTGSLNTLTNGDGTCHPVTQVPQLAYRQSSPPEQEYPVITEQVEPDKQMLIERIVKLQRMLARRNEKIEFIEDHTHQLVDELQKKNKIIQMYTLREETGTLTAEAADLSKAQLARKHSIMGSVYSSHQTDGTMTLDLSLEINRKLQAVLEDTLLKNMTLKESLDTLGEEISRLSQENRKMQLTLEQKRR